MTANKTLNERVTEDMKTAMRSGDKTRLETLRSLRAHFIELSKRGENKGITPEDELAVLMSAVKKRKEAIEMYRQGKREELARQEEQELEIINEYLPKQATREEAEQVVSRLVAQTGAVTAKDFGKVMPLAMKELKGRIDGKVVQELVKAKLEG
ncbi:MAG: GatB/YqeY domain-containing protein [Nitrososphaera sp.]|nr:GatB/YqeY domain-containing protein [Nitrososphaera sp.]MCI0705865.1 GatB/YqeY domain-containing protein [Ignavibacteriota bacterium]